MKKSDIKDAVIIGTISFVLCSILTYFFYISLMNAVVFLSSIDLGLFDEDMSEYYDVQIVITEVQLLKTVIEKEETKEPNVSISIPTHFPRFIRP